MGLVQSTDRGILLNASEWTHDSLALLQQVPVNLLVLPNERVQGIADDRTYPLFQHANRKRPFHANSR